MIFVMLNLPSGSMTPMKDDDEVVFFEDRLQAAEAIKGKPARCQVRRHDLRYRRRRYRRVKELSWTHLV